MLWTLTDKEYFKIDHIPMECIPCRYNHNNNYKNLDIYIENFKLFSNKDFVKSFNTEFEKYHSKEREVKLVALYHVFKSRFDKSPITLIDNNVIILNNKTVYLEKPDSLICYPEIS